MRKDYDLIRKTMKGRVKWYPYELQQRMMEAGKFMSESSLTRRLREMEDVFCSPPRNRRVSRAFTYQLIK